MVRRPKQVVIRNPSDFELAELAGRASYVGSPEHKALRWWGGLPEAHQLPGGRLGRLGKQTTTVCPLTEASDRDMATHWVKEAIRLRQFRFCPSDHAFPKRIWYEADGQCWMGLLVNPGNGEYKGWPIGKEERNEVFC